jgi:hypothetical protein
MSETVHVPEEITHLDFEPDVSPKCAGHKFKENDAGNLKISGNDFTCSNSAKVVVIRSCCGIINYYCISCYNDICTFHARLQMKNGSTHGDSPAHPVRGNPFARVEFL